MSVHESGTAVRRNDLQAITAVGGVRAHRIRRDTECDSIRDIANADLGVLQQVWSVGPHFARVIKGSAQALVHAWKDANELSGTRRVAVVAGEGTLDSLHDDVEAKRVVDNAVREAGIQVDADLEVGYVADGMGGDEVQAWADFQAFSQSVQSQPFATPWEKYARFLDPLRFVDDEFCEKHDISDISEVPAGRMPETVPLKTGIPFDVDRVSDVEWWMAPAERTNDLVRWADEVVIAVDGEYADSVRKTCEYENTTVTTVFELSLGMPVSYSGEDPEVETRTITVEDATVGEDGPREGSVQDLDDTPDGVHMNSAHADEESRVDRTDIAMGADPGGRGVGSNSDRW